MRRLIVLVMVLVAAALGCAGRSASKINGSGSTFVHPLMKEWAEIYGKERGVTVTYESIGSGVGFQRLTSRLFDFACTDAPLSESQLKSAEDAGGDVLHIPLVLGAVVAAYNLEGQDKPLVFSGPVLADIYLGKITRWDDSRIRELNPDSKLPETKITVIHRSDKSGTTYIWTDFLSKTSSAWEKKAGTGTNVDWPTGVGRDGNADVAEEVSKTPGSIGYVQMSYAIDKHIPHGLLKNREGKTVEANPKSITAAARNSLKDIPKDLRFSLTDAPGADSYPISGTVWALIYAKQPHEKRKTLVDFLRWATHEGQELASPLHYAPLPGELVDKVDAKLQQVENN